MLNVKLPLAVVLCLFLALQGTFADAQSTGTFVDRDQPTDLRILSYNISLDSLFKTDTAKEKFGRILRAVQPDVITLQEVFEHTAAETGDVIDALYTSPNGGSWHVHQGRGNVTLSRYPILMPAVSPVPAGERDLAMTLINLPDDQFAANLYLMNTHNDNGAGGGGNRGRQVDSQINWMRDARTLGGEITLAPGTPMIVLGTMNFSHGTGAALDRLISGEIDNNAAYGNSSPPDWDGSSLTDAHPYHNGITPEESGSAADYTWRNDNSVFERDRDNNIVFTDSAAQLGNRYVLNTTIMSESELTATGMFASDVLRDGTPNNFDNLPIVIDFRLNPTALRGDFDSDGVVSNLDYMVWKSNYGSATQHAADANADGVVDAADYTVWRDNRGSGAGSRGLAPVPEPNITMLFLASLAPIGAWRRRRF